MAGDSADEKGSANEPKGPVSPRSTLNSVFLVVACTTAMVASISAGTSSTIALPTIERDLDIPEVQLKWVISGYPLTSGCLLLIMGRLADLYGRKKAFILGSLWLLAFTIGCAFAQDYTTLDVLRALQGIGPAATMPASIGILAHAFPPSRARSIAFATFAAGAPVGSACGMILGGVVTEFTKQTWRSTFYTIAGLVTISLVSGIFTIDADTPSTELDQRVDWLGGFLVTVGLVLIVFVLGQGESAPQRWATPYIIALLVLGVLFLATFLKWQHYLDGIHGSRPSGPHNLQIKWTPPPLMSLKLWMRSRGRVAVIFCIAFLNFSCFMGWNYWILLYYQNYVGYSPLATVLRMLPMFVTGILCNVLVALLVGRISIIWLLGLGTAITSTASVLFALIDPDAPYWAFGFPAAIVAVVGADFVFAAGTIFVAKESLPEEQSVAGGVFQTMSQIGNSVGVTITTVVFNRILQRDSGRLGILPNPSGTNAPLAAQLASYKAAQWTAFGFGVVATSLGVLFFRGVGIVGHEEEMQSSMTVDGAGTPEKDFRDDNTR
ncbi:putative efflux transporter [Mycena floridula]|nr:putative efflux transporter [Mycena floridula]